VKVGVAFVVALARSGNRDGDLAELADISKER
jgi:hypothetical protein